MPRHPDERAPRPGRGAGAAALRARIEREGFAGAFGEAAYRAYMRALRGQAPADLASIGGRACHQALRSALGEDGYRERQRAGYAAACRTHGVARIQRHIARAHTERRQWRLQHPTPAEAALHAALQQLGLHIHPVTFATAADAFCYERWQDDHTPPVGGDAVVLEARAGRFFIDALLPAAAIAIEVEGGVHQLHRDNDRRRRAWLQRQGLTVLTYQNTDVCAPTFPAALAADLRAHQKGPP